jgi:hypothetical protein
MTFRLNRQDVVSYPEGPPKRIGLWKSQEGPSDCHQQREIIPAVSIGLLLSPGDYE